MTITPWRHGDDVVRPQDFDGDRHRAENHYTAAAFGAALVPPAFEETWVAPGATLVTPAPTGDFIDDDEDDELWPLPGHNIVLGGLADDHIFGSAENVSADEAVRDDAVDAATTVRADPEFEIVDTPDPHADEPTAFVEDADRLGMSDIAQIGRGEDEALGAARDYLQLGTTDGETTAYGWETDGGVDITGFDAGAVDADTDVGYLHMPIDTSSVI